jgi:hypothetical protein
MNGFDMKTATQISAVLLAFLAGFAVRAADKPVETARVSLIAGLAEETAYIPRLKAIRSLETETPLSDAERASLLAFLRRTDRAKGTDEMELAALKNDVTEHLLKLPDMPGGFALDLLDMQADANQSATWRNYCVQFLGRTYKTTPDAALRAAVRERLYLLAESPDPETCGTSLMSLASLNGHPEIDSARVAARAMTVAKDAAKTEGLRLSALQVAAGLGHASAAPMAREWLAKEKSANLRAIAIAVLGKCGTPADRALIEPYVADPDPRLNGAARAVFKLPRKATAQAAFK